MYEIYCGDVLTSTDFLKMALRKAWEKHYTKLGLSHTKKLKVVQKKTRGFKTPPGFEIRNSKLIKV